MAEASFDGLSALTASAELCCCALEETAAVLHEWLAPHCAHDAIAIIGNGAGTPLSLWAGPAFAPPATLDWSSATIGDDLGRPVLIAGGDAASAGATIIVVLTRPGTPTCTGLELALHGLARVLAGRIACPASTGDGERVAQAHAVAAERDRVTHELSARFAQHLHTLVRTLADRDVGALARAHAGCGVASRALLALRANRGPVWRQTRSVDEAFGALARDLGDLARAARLTFAQGLSAPDDQHLPATVLDAAACVTRAAVLNVVEHSGARRVRVEWRVDAGELALVVADDGCGFDPGRDHGGGLEVMRWRAQALDGTVQVESVPGWGTRVEARLPLTADRVAAADASAGAALRALGDRELEVLRLMAFGHRNREIAEELFLSQHTVKFHVARIFGKLGVRSRAEAAAVALAAGIDPHGPPVAAAA